MRNFVLISQNEILRRILEEKFGRKSRLRITRSLDVLYICEDMPPALAENKAIKKGPTIQPDPIYAVATISNA